MQQVAVADASLANLMSLFSAGSTEFAMFVFAVFMYMVAVRGVKMPSVKPKMKQPPSPRSSGDEPLAALDEKPVAGMSPPNYIISIFVNQVFSLLEMLSAKYKFKQNELEAEKMAVQKAEARIPQLEVEKTVMEADKVRFEADKTAECATLWLLKEDLKAQIARLEAEKKQLEADRTTEHAMHVKVKQCLEARVAELQAEIVARREADSEKFEASWAAERAMHVQETADLRTQIAELEAAKLAKHQADEEGFEADKTAECTLHATATGALEEQIAELQAKKVAVLQDDHKLEASSYSCGQYPVEAEDLVGQLAVVEQEVQRLTKKCQEFQAEQERCQTAAEHAVLELGLCVAQRDADVELLKKLCSELQRTKQHSARLVERERTELIAGIESSRQSSTCLAEQLLVERAAEGLEKQSDTQDLPEALKNTMEENGRLKDEVNKCNAVIAQLSKEVDQKEAIFKGQEKTIQDVYTEYWDAGTPRDHI